MTTGRTILEACCASLSAATGTTFTVERHLEVKTGFNPTKGMQVRKTYSYRLVAERGEHRQVFFRMGTTYRNMVRFVSALEDMHAYGFLDKPTGEHDAQDGTDRRRGGADQGAPT